MVSTLSLIFTVIGAFSLKHNMMTANAEKLRLHQITESQISNTATGLIIYTILIGLISIGLWLWMAWANGRGKGWARTVAAALAWTNAGFWLIGEWK